MPTPLESKAALNLTADRAVADATTVLESASGSAVQQRRLLLEAVPEVIGYYGLGAAVLAADLYDEQRAAAGLSGFTAAPVVLDRTVKIRRGIAWASDPLFTGDWDTALSRLVEVVQPETVRPYRDTILTNSHNDAKCVGWRRITTGGCGFCQMLAARGAVYKEATAHFAAHPNCHCTAAPVFLGGAVGPEASVIQYMASGRVRSEKEKAKVRALVDYYEGR